MAPKFDPNEVKYVFLRQYGGEPAAASVRISNFHKTFRNVQSKNQQITFRFT